MEDIIRQETEDFGVKVTCILGARGLNIGYRN
jgi:hypothetical protein